MRADIKTAVTNTFNKVKIDETILKKWKEYVPKVCNRLRNTSVMWRRFDVSFQKTTNKIFKVIYDGTKNHAFKLLKEQSDDISGEEADDNDASFSNTKVKDKESLVSVTDILAND